MVCCVNSYSDSYLITYAYSHCSCTLSSTITLNFIHTISKGAKRFQDGDRSHPPTPLNETLPTGFSRFEMLYGREVQGPQEVLKRPGNKQKMTLRVSSSCLQSFKVGEQVLVILPSNLNMLEGKWLGPHLVTNKVTDINGDCSTCTHTPLQIISLDTLW